MIIIVQCAVPDDLAQAWLQHLRNFDVAHPNCHFEVLMEAEKMVPVRDMVEMLKVEPELSVLEVFKRAKE